MKLLTLYLFLIFFTLQTSSQADDIRDFQIEGMSIGDSALDYFSKSEIDNDFYTQEYEFPEKNVYKRIYIENKTFNDFEYVAIDVKVRDLKYIIVGVTGMDNYEDPKKCFDKQNKIAKTLLSIFNKKPKKYTLPEPLDKTGISKMHYVEYYFRKGRVQAICYVYGEHMNIESGLDLSIRSEKFQKWLNKIK